MTRSYSKYVEWHSRNMIIDTLLMRPANNDREPFVEFFRQ
jgi:hypothetical protein